MRMKRTKVSPFDSITSVKNLWKLLRLSAAHKIFNWFVKDAPKWIWCYLWLPHAKVARSYPVPPYKSSKEVFTCVLLPIDAGWRQVFNRIKVTVYKWLLISCFTWELPQPGGKLTQILLLAWPYVAVPVYMTQARFIRVWSLMWASWLTPVPKPSVNQTGVKRFTE
jgi:hypothetical protein